RRTVAHACGPVRVPRLLYSAAGTARPGSSRHQGWYIIPNVPAARTSPVYPFTPKSITPLLPGQFWAIPPHNGRFACGRVLQINRQPDRYALNTTRSFLAGLMSWTGDTEPTGETIAGAHLLDQGQAHIKTIITTGGQILGHRPLELDNIQPLTWV